jgi:hypothetical protein
VVADLLGQPDHQLVAHGRRDQRVGVDVVDHRPDLPFHLAHDGVDLDRVGQVLDEVDEHPDAGQGPRPRDGQLGAPVAHEVAQQPGQVLAGGDLQGDDGQGEHQAGDRDHGRRDHDQQGAGVLGRALEGQPERGEPSSTSTRDRAAPASGNTTTESVGSTHRAPPT